MLLPISLYSGKLMSIMLARVAGVWVPLSAFCLARSLPPAAKSASLKPRSDWLLLPGSDAKSNHSTASLALTSSSYVRPRGTGKGTRVGTGGAASAAKSPQAASSVFRFRRNEFTRGWVICLHTAKAMSSFSSLLADLLLMSLRLRATLDAMVSPSAS